MVRKSLIAITFGLLAGCGPGPTELKSGILVSYGCADNCYAIMRIDWSENAFTAQEVPICNEDYDYLIGKKVMLFRQPEGQSDRGCNRLYEYR